MLLVENDEYEVYEGEDEDNPQYGKNTVCWVAPVQDGVDVRLVCHVCPAGLNVGKVGHHVNQAEQLHMVEVETPPGSADIR